MPIVARLLSTGTLRASLFDELSAVSSNVGVTSTGTFYSNGIQEGSVSNLISSTPMRITSDKQILVYDFIDELSGLSETLSGYTISTGTKLPVYGTGGGSYPPTGSWTGIQNASVDDGFLTITLPFTFYIAGGGYTTTYMGSNTYLTFSSGSSLYSGLSASNPALPKFMFGAADNSYQRVSTYASGSNYMRIRYEGNGSTSGTVGTPGITLEITLFNPSLFGNKNVLELLVGNHNRTNGVANVANASTAYATYTQAANQSYVFEGNSDGTSWTIYTGYYVSGTDY